MKLRTIGPGSPIRAPSRFRRQGARALEVFKLKRLAASPDVVALELWLARGIPPSQLSPALEALLKATDANIPAANLTNGRDQGDIEKLNARREHQLDSRAGLARRSPALKIFRSLHAGLLPLRRRVARSPSSRGPAARTRHFGSAGFSGCRCGHRRSALVLTLGQLRARLPTARYLPLLRIVEVSGMSSCGGDFICRRRRATAVDVIAHFFGPPCFFSPRARHFLHHPFPWTRVGPSRRRTRRSRK